MTNDEIFMKKAIRKAKKAASLGEVPVGCVIVRNGRVIASGYNKRETKQNALLHAEITAISAACKKAGAWRLWDCEMYVTLEPCPMCAGAIINSRIRRVVFGAFDPKAGALGSVVNLNDYPFNHKCEIVSGVLGGECSELLSGFFRSLRKQGV
ncbi:MAG: nucleoside deaminase [Clostridiales bacterium]|nr:nucleoside deaminase [Clostridiales bacterium]